eukprot:8979214-Lingulodinium_polyedra.AAC.1
MWVGPAWAVSGLPLFGLSLDIEPRREPGRLARAAIEKQGGRAGVRRPLSGSMLLRTVAIPQSYTIAEAMVSQC